MFAKQFQFITRISPLTFAIGLLALSVDCTSNLDPTKVQSTSNPDVTATATPESDQGDQVEEKELRGLDSFFSSETSVQADIEAKVQECMADQGFEYVPQGQSGARGQV